jgi:predicted AlkP superfamily phosphohydrolase/phosphomutase
MTRRILCAIVLIAACALHACGRRPPVGPKMIVLGFDGLDYALTKQMLDAGRLPNFARLAKSGSFTPLETTIPPQSPVAWGSFITGLDPGGHGLFDFIHRDAHTMAPYLSTTRTEPSKWTIKVGTRQFPLTSGSVTLLRDGHAFWESLESHGVHASILRMPDNFPPSGSASVELSGMGTPDLLGTYGTFAFYTSEPFAFAGRTVAGGTVHQVRIVDGTVRAELRGPDNPYRTTPQPVSVPFTAYVDTRARAAKLAIGASGDEQRLLTVGEWSDWVPIEFPLIDLPIVGGSRLRGMCRFYLKQVDPYFQLYVTPINLDPMAPALPISTPRSFARDLARATGRFYTQGMPEDTKAFTAGVFDADEFLRQARLAQDEVRRQYRDVLDRFEGGLLFYYVGNVDQVSHMMWRSMDPEHPAYNAETDARYRTVIEDLYVELDRMVGETLDRIARGPDAHDTTLVVMSDHGFTSWRRTFHLNAWLEQNGYLSMRSGAARDVPLLGAIEWSRTRAYGLGLNGLYLNVAGRERHGIVDASARAALADEIATKLRQVIDPATGQAAIANVYPRDRAFRGVARPDIAPDLIIGYAKGTRGSNESALGEVPAEILTDNRDQWSGDHCMDPPAVPGVLFTSRPLKTRPARLQDVAGALLGELGIAPFPPR